MAFIPRKIEVSRSGSLKGGNAYLTKLKESFRKPSSSQRSPVIGGEDSFKNFMSRIRKPVQVQKKELKKEVKKEIKKDTSIFQGSPYVTREKIRGWLKKDEAWKITKLSAKERLKLEKKVFNPKDPRNIGIYIDPREANMVLKDFENFPNRAKTRYGMKNRNETRRVRNLMRKLVGK